MGMEMDPRELTEKEQQQLSQAVALHKKHRALIHSGQLIRLDSDGDAINFGIINAEKSQALFAYNSVKETQRTTPPKLRFIGLEASKTYQLTLIWPSTVNEYSPSILSKINEQKFNGEVLMQFGMQLPVLFPQSALIFELNEVS